MTKTAYMYLSIVLAVIVVGLLAYIFTRPTQPDTTAIQSDLSQFSTELSAWNAAYGANPTPQNEQQLSGDLTTLSGQLQSYK